MTRRVFYRVHDDSCGTSYSPGTGFVAGNRDKFVRMFPLDEGQKWKLLRFAAAHLEWKCRRPSPFISVYSNLATARREARARVYERGKRRVMIAHIYIDKDLKGMCFRHARGIAKITHMHVPPEAWHNSKHEYLFFKRIPEEAITRIESFTNDDDDDTDTNDDDDE